jgi:hypothetical protein
VRLAIAYGDDSYASATGGTGDYALAGGTNAFALAGGESTDTGANYDTAIDVGNNSGKENGAVAVDGNGNYASESANTTGGSLEAYSGQGNDNIAVGTSDNTTADALGGDGNYAYVDGPANSTAAAYDGDSNIAYVSDPFGAVGSPDDAIAGGFSNDLAEVLLAHGSATADIAPLLYDIISLFGNFSGSF